MSSGAGKAGNRYNPNFVPLGQRAPPPPPPPPGPPPRAAFHRGRHDTYRPRPRDNSRGYDSYRPGRNRARFSRSPSPSRTVDARVLNDPRREGTTLVGGQRQITKPPPTTTMTKTSAPKTRAAHERSEKEEKKMTSPPAKKVKSLPAPQKKVTKKKEKAAASSSDKENEMPFVTAIKDPADVERLMIAAHYNKQWRILKLREALRERGLSDDGNRWELSKRLSEDDKAYEALGNCEYSAATTPQLLKEAARRGLKATKDDVVAILENDDMENAKAAEEEAANAVSIEDLQEEAELMGLHDELLSLATKRQLSKWINDVTRIMYLKHVDRRARLVKAKKTLLITVPKGIQARILATLRLKKDMGLDDEDTDGDRKETGGPSKKRARDDDEEDEAQPENAESSRKKTKSDSQINTSVYEIFGGRKPRSPVLGMSSKL